jgi:two-component system NtrC family response regulator
MVKEGRFREDLYYRLLVVPITLPPLREREGDVAELVQHFFLKLRARHGRPELVLPASIVSLFSQYRWPGNIRELENTVERIVLLARGPEICNDDLPDFLKSSSVSPQPTKPPAMMSLPEGELNLEAIEKQLILQAMEKCKGNQTRAAKYLSMTRRALGYRLEKYALRERCSKSPRRG